MVITKQIGWVEAVCLIILAIGFIFSLFAHSAMMFYIISFLTGTIFGRLWFRTRKQLQFKYILMILAFIVGYVIGNVLTRYGDPKITVLAYFLGIVISFYLHSKKLMQGIDF